MGFAPPPRPAAASARRIARQTRVVGRVGVVWGFAGVGVAASGRPMGTQRPPPIGGCLRVPRVGNRTPAPPPPPPCASPAEVGTTTVRRGSCASRRPCLRATTEQKVATSATTEQKVATSATTEQKVATSATTEQKVATSATTEQKVATSATTEQKVATSATTEQKVATSATTEQKVATSATTEQKVATSRQDHHKHDTAPLSLYNWSHKHVMLTTKFLTIKSEIKIKPAKQRSDGVPVLGRACAWARRGGQGCIGREEGVGGVTKGGQLQSVRM